MSFSGAPMLLGVAGMVGCGKSTLTYSLATRFGLQLAPESVDASNPWLPLFYGSPGGMRAYALNLQLHFLATRFEALRQMRGKGGSWILDRTWYEDAEIFARGLHEDGLLSPLEFDLYQRLYSELLYSPAARPPRLLLYLHGPLDMVVSRIEQRGRPSERHTDFEYWEHLHARYAKWISTFRHCPVISLDIREYDLVRDPGVVDEIAATVRRRLEPDIPQTELWPAAIRQASIA
jgi:deoxyadenosine/deoxycytidine kinase